MIAISVQENAFMFPWLRKSFSYAKILFQVFRFPLFQTSLRRVLDQNEITRNNMSSIFKDTVPTKNIKETFSSKR